MNNSFVNNNKIKSQINSFIENIFKTNQFKGIPKS